MSVLVSVSLALSPGGWRWPELAGVGASYDPSEFKGWSSTEYWAEGAFTAVSLFVSVPLHELGHSLVALNRTHKTKSRACKTSSPSALGSS